MPPRSGIDQDNFVTHRVLVEGMNASGRKSLVLRYADRMFLDKPIDTLGVGFKVRTIELDQAPRVRQLLWWCDHTRQYDYAHRSHFVGLRSLIFCIPVNASENELNEAFQKLHNMKRDLPDRTHFILAATKSDLLQTMSIVERQRSSEALSYFAKRMQLAPPIFLSAKTNDGVEEVFTLAAHQFLCRVKEENSRTAIITNNGKPTESRVVLFDVDDTLISSTSLGQPIRPLLFPETTKEIIEKLQSQGDYVIISSSATPTQVIIDSLVASDISCDHIKIAGSEETNQWAEGPHGKKLTKALSIMTELGANAVITVDDATSINSEHDQIVHILVPTPPQNEMLEDQPPESDNYLKAVLLPTDILKLQVKPLVRDVISSKHKGMIDHECLNNLYDGITVIPPEAVGLPAEPQAGINMQVLSGFIAVIGITSVAIAFIALNAATFGTAGLVVAAIGLTATLLGGIGLFKYAHATDNPNQALSVANGLT